MSELKGYIEATKILPALEDITITPSKQEQNFKSKVDGYDNIRVNAIPCETLNVKPKREKQVIEGLYDKVNVDAIQAEILNVTPTKQGQYFDGLYEKIYVDKITGDDLTVTPTRAEQSFNGLYENVYVQKVTGDTLNILPREEQQSFNGIYENVYVEPVETEEVTLDPDFSSQDTFEVTATEGKYIIKATVNKPANLVSENILDGNNIYGVDGTFKPLDTSDATATAGDIAQGKTAYINGEKVIGVAMPSFDTSQIRSCNAMFSDNTVMTEISGLDTSNVTDMAYMCRRNSALKHVPVLDTSSVKDGGLMYAFFNCPNLTDESLNNIMRMCINAVNNTTSVQKTLAKIGLDSTQQTRCQSLSNYQEFYDAGWRVS